MTINRNTKSVITNPYQNKHLKVLTVCSGGVLRSPTAATLLTQLYNFNCRSCGTEDYALVKISQIFVYCSDVILTMEYYHQTMVQSVMNNCYLDDEPRPLVRVLEIPDDFGYMDPQLQELMKNKFEEWNFNNYDLLPKTKP